MLRRHPFVQTRGEVGEKDLELGKKAGLDDFWTAKGSLCYRAAGVHAGT
jgi:hypothetical protein